MTREGASAAFAPSPRDSASNWHNGTLADVISDIRGGFSVNAEDRPARPGELGVLKTGAVLDGRLRPKENKAVLPGEVGRVRTSVAAGTIVFCRKNSEEVIGASALVEDDCPSLFLSDLLWQITPSELVHRHWLAAVVMSDRVRSLIRISSTGTQSSMKNISQDRFLAIPVQIPPLPEQRKIAEILWTWDEALEKQDKLLKLRELQYLGLRNRLINWSSPNKVSLREVIQPVSRPVDKPSRAYTAISIRSHGKGTFTRSVDDPSSVDMDTLFQVSAGDLIANITFAWEGAIALVPNEHHGGLVSHRFPTFLPKTKRVCPRYLRHALRMPRFTYLLGTVSPGGAGRNRVLNKSDFLDLRMPLPSLKNQRKISLILDDCEALIGTVGEFRNALNRQKRGLMQKLLTGEWRVRLDGKEGATA